MSASPSEDMHAGVEPPRRKPPTVNAWLAVLLLLIVGVLLTRDRMLTWTNLFDPQAEPRPIMPRGDLADDEQSTIEIAKAASPSVVHIMTLAVRSDALKMNLFELPQGSGSGFIWDEQGHVVTNFHVIRNAQGARVTLSDNSTWDARLVGVEPDKDLAVLKIDAPTTKLRPIPIGTSADLQVGQKVFAIGNPFGLDQTLTAGVISGLGREIQSVTQRPITGVIQTDAAINPGNSGGTLLDSAGRLIGVNTAIYSQDGSYSGIGFAVPVDTVNRIVPQLIRTGRADHAGFGVTVADDALSRRLEVGTGVLVLEVLPGSAGDAAGMRPSYRDESGKVVFGDIITEIDGRKIEDADDLYRALDNRTVGETVAVVVRRGDDLVTLEVQLQSLRRNE